MTAKDVIPQEIFEHDFIALFKRSSHPREQMRYLAFSHLQDGKTPREVAAIIRTTRNTVYRWLRNFQLKGLEGLREQPGRGKKPLIPDSKRDAFRKAVEELQAERSGGAITGKDVLRLMEEKYGVKCTLRSAYNHLKRASLVWITARSRHPNADLEQQEALKKTFDKK